MESHIPNDLLSVRPKPLTRPESTMKYSLRSLMIVVTLIGVGFGGRVEYLRQRADFHSSECDRLVRQLAMEYDTSDEQMMKALAKTARLPRHFFNGSSVTYRDYPRVKREIPVTKRWLLALDHQRLAEVYRQAFSRPWLFVDEAAVVGPSSLFHLKKADDEQYRKMVPYQIRRP